MAKGRGDFGERDEDEVSQKHAGMWDLEIGSGDGVVAVEEDVQVDQARAFGEGFFAAHLRFDVAECREELRGREIGLRFEDGVEEPGLIEIINGLGFVDAGDSCDADGGFAEESDGFAQVCLAVANVGAQRQVDGNHMLLLFYAGAAAEKAEHGVGFGQFQGEADGEEDDAVKTENENGEKDVAAWAKNVEKAAGRGGGEERGNPNLNEKRKGQTNMAGAATERALEERELNPGSDTGRNGETGDTPAGFNTEEARKGQGREITKSGSENDADNGEAQRSAGVAEGVEAGGVEAAEGGSEKADGGTGENSPDVDNVIVGEAAGLIDGGDDDIAENEETDDGGDDEE